MLSPVEAIRAVGWWVVLHQQRQPGRPGVHGPAHGRSSMRFSSATRMLVGVATRQYARSLEPGPADVVSRGTSKSSVSRRFVAKTTV